MPEPGAGHRYSVAVAVERSARMPMLNDQDDVDPEATSRHLEYALQHAILLAFLFVPADANCEAATVRPVAV